MYWLAGLTLVISILPFGGYFFLKELLDIIEDNTQEPFTWPLLGLAGIWLLHPGLQNILQYRLETTELKVQQHLTSLILGKSAGMPLAYYEDPGFFDTLHRAQEESAYRPTLILQACLTLLQGAAGASLALSILIQHAWWLGLIFTATLLPAVYLKIYYSHKLYEDQLATTGLRRKAWYIQQVITAKRWAQELRIFQFAIAWQTKYREIAKNLLDRQSHILWQRTQGSLLTQGFETLVLVGALYFFVRQAWAGLISLGTLVLMVQVLQRGQGALQMVLSSLVQLYHNHLFARHIYQFLHLESPKKNIPLVPPPQVIETIKLSGVSFQYPFNNTLTINNLSLSWQRGELLAMVGKNGSGKSTLMKLLSQFYPEYQGRIDINGEDLRNFDEEGWRKKISVVLQDYGMYQITAGENIQLGSIDVSRSAEEMDEAAKTSGILETVSGWPQGFDTVLGKEYVSGKELSGGQWQRLAISRALYKNADVLILDEPTSAIDALTEYRMLSEIKTQYAQRFLLLITHRLHNLRLADRIIVLENGQICESGTYQELIQKQGHFYALFQHQL